MTFVAIFSLRVTSARPNGSVTIRLLVSCNLLTAVMLLHIAVLAAVKVRSPEQGQTLDLMPPNYRYKDE